MRQPDDERSSAADEDFERQLQRLDTKFRLIVAGGILAMALNMTNIALKFVLSS